LAHLINCQARASHWTHITHTHLAARLMTHGHAPSPSPFLIDCVRCAVSIRPSSAMQVAHPSAIHQQLPRLIMASMFSFSLGFFLLFPFFLICHFPLFVGHRICSSRFSFFFFCPHFKSLDFPGTSL